MPPVMHGKKAVYGDPNVQPQMLAPNFVTIPEGLADVDRWLCWKLVWKANQAPKAGTVPGKWTKQPKRIDGRAGSSTDSATWSTFAQVRDAYATGRFSGVGIALGDGLTGVDMDHCRNPETGIVEPWAMEIVVRLRSYTEISPSGTGLKIFCRGTWHGTWHRRQQGSGEVEVYDRGRYFTATGLELPDHRYQVNDAQEALDELAAMKADDRKRAPADSEDGSEPVNQSHYDPSASEPTDTEDGTGYASDEAVLARAIRSRTGAKFQKLWQGDTSEYRGDDSRADLALCNLLAFFIGYADEGRVDQLFRGSGLMREKWESKRGPSTYGAITVAKSLDGRTEFYSASRPTPTPEVVAEDFVPFPTDHLPEPLRSFVAHHTVAIGCDASFLVIPLLAACASSIGSTRTLRLRSGWFARAILWGAVVGESGSLKTPAFAAALKPWRDRQNDAFDRHEKEMECFVIQYERWKVAKVAWDKDKNRAEEPPEEPKAPVAQRCIVNDTTIEALAPILLGNPRGVLNARDELNTLFGGMDRYAKGKGSDAAAWLSAYNGEPIIIDRKTGFPRTIRVPAAYCSIVGGIQPGILKRALTPEHRESGLAARFGLLAYPPRKEKVWREPKDCPELAAAMDSLVAGLFGLEPQRSGDDPPKETPVVIHPKAEAKQMYVDYYHEHAAEQKDLSGDLSAAWSKLEEIAARLALVVHCVKLVTEPAHPGGWMRNPPLDAESMASGIALAKWFKSEARRVYAMLGESESDTEQRKTIEWLQRQGKPVAPWFAQQRCSWLRAQGAAEFVFNDLAKSGHGAWVDGPKSPKGGACPRLFQLKTSR